MQRAVSLSADSAGIWGHLWPVGLDS